MTSRGLYHRRLDTWNAEIRLIILYPATPFSPLHGRLFYARLYYDKPKYLALSYVWGSTVSSSTIILNGVSHPISPNLDLALRYARSSNKRHVYWIDAICINQTDLAERSAQVSMMAEIYSSATLVLICLGEPDYRSACAIRNIRKIVEHRATEDVLKQTFAWYRSIEGKNWFERTWPIQEMALSKHDPLIMCGYSITQWTRFIEAWRIAAKAIGPEYGWSPWNASQEKHFSDERKIVKTYFSHFEALDTVRSNIKAFGGVPLDVLFAYALSCSASEPKDAVFALLGMLVPAERALVQVNYHRPTRHVFAEATRLILSKAGGLDFISSMGLHNGLTTIPELPSWVPDFHAKGKRNKIRPGILFASRDGTGVCGSVSDPARPIVLRGLRRLRVRSVPVDVVEECVVFPWTITGICEQLPSLELLCSRARKRSCPNEKLQPLYQKYSRAEPLWKIIALNRRHDRQDKSPQYFSELYNILLSVSNSMEHWDAEKAGEDRMKAYLGFLRQHLPGSVFFSTCHGLLGIGNPGVCKGDKVAIWLGARMPFIVREIEGRTDRVCAVVSAAYVSGIMAGEFINEAYQTSLVEEETWIVE